MDIDIVRNIVSSLYGYPERDALFVYCLSNRSQDSKHQQIAMRLIEVKLHPALDNGVSRGTLIKIDLTSIILIFILFIQKKQLFFTF